MRITTCSPNSLSIVNATRSRIQPATFVGGCGEFVSGNRAFLPSHHQKAIRKRIARQRQNARGFVAGQVPAVLIPAVSLDKLRTAEIGDRL